MRRLIPKCYAANGAFLSLLIFNPCNGMYPPFLRHTIYTKKKGLKMFAGFDKYLGMVYI